MDWRSLVSCQTGAIPWPCFGMSRLGKCNGSFCSSLYDLAHFAPGRKAPPNQVSFFGATFGGDTIVRLHGGREGGRGYHNASGVDKGNARRMIEECLTGPDCVPVSPPVCARLTGRGRAWIIPPSIVLKTRCFHHPQTSPSPEGWSTRYIGVSSVRCMYRYDPSRPDKCREFPQELGCWIRVYNGVTICWCDLDQFRPASVSGVNFGNKIGHKLRLFGRVRGRSPFTTMCVWLKPPYGDDTHTQDISPKACDRAGAKIEADHKEDAALC